MKRILAFIVLVSMAPIMARAQYAGSTSGSTTAAAEINSKPTVQVSASTASGNCTAGKDIWIQTTGHFFYCSATNTWTELLPTTGTAPLATAIAGGSSGQVPYQTGAGVTAFNAGLAFNSSTGLGIIHDVTVGQGGTASGCLNANGLTSGTVKVCAADAAGGTTFKLPAADGSNGQFIKTNGSGVLSFGTAGGTGTVTVVGSGSLTSTALVTGGGTTTLQTPAATATMDASGNISTPGTITSGAGGSVAGMVGLGQGTSTAAGTGQVGFRAPTSVTTPFLYTLPAAPTTGFMLATGTADPSVITHVAGATAATANTVALRNASGEVIAANAVATGKTAMATDTAVAQSQLSAAEKTRRIGCVIDGQGSVVTTNSVCDAGPIPYAATVTAWSIEAEGTNPACTVDILTLAAGHTLASLSGSSITASAKPALTSTFNSMNSVSDSVALTGWTTAITAWDKVAFKAVTPGAATKITAYMYFTVN